MDNTSLPTEPAPVALSFLGHHTGMSVKTLKQAFLDNLFFVQGKPVALATKHDYYMALAYLVREWYGRKLHKKTALLQFATFRQSF